VPRVLDSATFGFGSEPLFRGFSLDLEDGSMTALMGPSGCGKTTLLHLIAGLYAPTAGTAARGADGMLSAYIFQEPRLFPARTLLENVAIPVEKTFGRTGARERAGRFLSLVGLGGREGAYPDELSGGQRQRAALARAFAYPAPLILMDEPFQSLDLPLRIQLMDLIRELLAGEPRTALFVTHDPREAIYAADRVLALRGKPVEVVLDERIGLSRKDREYASSAGAVLEARLFAALASE